MLEENLLRNIGYIIVAAAVFAALASLIRLPTIVAYLFAGVVIGPLTGLVEISDPIRAISEVGIVLLLFLVGLELSFDKIRDVGKVAVWAGLGQVVFTALGGYAFCWLLGFPPMESLFLAVGLTFSSTVVVVKVLSDKGELDSLYGRIAVGIFLVQDLVVIVVLTVLSGLSRTGENSLERLAWQLGGAFGGMILLLGGVLLAARYLLPRPFRWASASPETIFIWSLCWCFLVVTVAHGLHLSVEIGAFLAGLSLAQLPYNRDLQHRIKPLMSFFVAVFFVSLGVRLEPSLAVTHWWPILALSLFVIIGNPLIFMWIIARMGYGEKTSFLTSVTVAQISEFSFIFAAMGVSAGLVGNEVMAIMAMVGVITIAISAYGILYNGPLYEWVARWGLLRFFKANQESPTSLTQGSWKNHIIIVGMNTLGRSLASQLVAQGETVVAVDTDPGKLRGLPSETVLGNIEYLDVVEELGLASAKLVISALQIEEVNELIAFRCREAKVKSAIAAVDFSVVDNLLELDVNYLILPKVDGVKLQSRLLVERGLLPS